MELESSRYFISAPGVSNARPQPLRVRGPAGCQASVLLGITAGGQELVFQRLVTEGDAEHPVYLGMVRIEDGDRLSLREPTEEECDYMQGIATLPSTKEEDAFRRLDTGYFDIELCRGTGRGEGASKWGIRHFARKEEGVDLLQSGNNAIGGFYGPFFTPENGLINPPEHLVADIRVLEEGPVVHRYQLSGRIPDGLLPELRAKHFSVDFTFYHNADFFDRVYQVDSFQTRVNGRSVTDCITVGDEFEGGQGRLVFDRFDSYSNASYRAGDPYAECLKEEVKETIASQEEDNPADPDGSRYQAFRKLLNRDLDNAHWDLYWRLFSYWEHALADGSLNRHLAKVRAKAHVLADLNNRPWLFPQGAVDVSAANEETIFVGPSDCSAEYDSATGRCMVWQTSQASAAFQIVQRPQSGWVNWGTNGENECPALPVDVDIRTIYGPYGAGWRSRAQEASLSPLWAKAEQ
ncbi:hypothetical protein CRD60_06330 [Bifidobacterium aemilianum]|uniref:Uncharacterized protein n=1 Tax=Bifidobacterium aemilianum TaxID=2493120 RepID=A0A366K8Z9_9BIFI|nr:hypothetical protein [Bifidobacterium aemilianum]RBP97603.1 hypothetical protein CRD60_06330 [Bifidobacterium aemilianum]